MLINVFRRQYKDRVVRVDPVLRMYYFETLSIYNKYGDIG